VIRVSLCIPIREHDHAAYGLAGRWHESRSAEPRDGKLEPHHGFQASVSALRQ